MRTFSWISPKIEVREANEHGKGVFANEKINERDLICIFGGYIMTVEEEVSSPEFQDEAMQIHENFVLGIKKKSQLETTSYFNHSCNPNAGFNGQIFLVAMRDIQKDEQITFDYAMVLHDVKGVTPYELDCKCEQDNCRGKITVNDWKKEELQKKYSGFFQWYLQEKINSIKNN